jgi:hypothetical protein
MQSSEGIPNDRRSRILFDRWRRDKAMENILKWDVVVADDLSVVAYPCGSTVVPPRWVDRYGWVNRYICALRKRKAMNGSVVIAIVSDDLTAIV